MQRLRQPPKSEAYVRCLQLAAVLSAADAGNEGQAVHTVPVAAAHSRTASLACLKGACGSHPTCRCYTHSRHCSCVPNTMPALGHCELCRHTQRSLPSAAAATHPSAGHADVGCLGCQQHRLVPAGCSTCSTSVYRKCQFVSMADCGLHSLCTRVQDNPVSMAGCRVHSPCAIVQVSFASMADCTLPAQEHTQEHVCRVPSKTAAHPARQPTCSAP